jgi:peroxiredoxin
MHRGRRAALLAVTLAIPVGLLAYALASSGHSSSAAETTPTSIGPAFDARKAVVGHPVPDFVLPSTAGGTVQLSQFRGKPVVLTFFASWCHPCEQELPQLQKIADANRDHLTVIGVNYQDIDTDSRRFVNRLGVTFPTLVESEVTNPVAARYGVHEIPLTYLIDAHGVLQSTPVFGPATAHDMQSAIDKLLAS